MGIEISFPQHIIPIFQYSIIPLEIEQSNENSVTRI